MEKLDLKKFQNFETDLSSIYGGIMMADRKTTIANTCDVHHDTNNNGKIDIGEHLTIVEC